MYHIREATVNDAATIKQLAEDTWWPTYSPLLEKEQIEFMLGEIYSLQQLTEQLTTGSQSYLLLVEDDQPVGFAAYSPREENPDIYKLHKIYCLPSTRGKGYGKILIETVIGKVLQAGKNVLDLNVNRHNNAIGFYQKMGFEIIYQEDIPIGPYWMNDHVMRKLL